MFTRRRTLAVAAALLLALPESGPGQAPKHPGPADLGLPRGTVARLGTAVAGKTAFVSGLALAPDGKTLAVAEERTAVRFLDLVGGAEVRRLTIPELGATHVAFTPDGRGLACAAHRGPVRVFAADTGKQTAQYGDADWLVGSLVFSADGAVLAAGNDQFAEQQMVLPVWDTATGKLLARVEPVQNFRVGVALAADGRTLASWGQYISPDRKDPEAERERGRTVQLWDVRTGKEARRLRTGSAVARAAFAPDGRTLAVATETAVTLWDAHAGKEVREAHPWAEEKAAPPFLRADGGLAVVSLVFARDGKTLAAARKDGTIARWEIPGGKVLAGPKRPHGSAPDLFFLPDGRLVAGAAEMERLTLWDVLTEKPFLPIVGHQSAVTGVVFPPEGGRLWSVDAEGGVLLWDTAAAAVVRQTRLSGIVGRRSEREGMSAPSFSPDGRYLLGSVAYSATRVWESASGKVVCALKGLANTDGLGNLPDGKLVALTQGDQGELSLWEVPSGRLVRTLRPPAGNPPFPTMPRVVLSPDGRVVAAMNLEFVPGQNQVGVALLLWETDAEKPPRRIAGLSSELAVPLAFTPDARVLLALGAKGLHLIDVAAAKEVRRIAAVQFSAVVPVGLEVRAPVAFSPCGRLVACADHDPAKGGNRINVIECATGSPRFQFTGPNATVRSLAFSPDGRTLATGDMHALILLWDLAGSRHEAAPTSQELEAAWAALIDTDGPKGWQAISRLIDAPRDSVPFLRERLKPLYADALPEEKVLKGLLARLDSVTFKERQEADAALARLGPPVKPFLVQALNDGPTLETRRRLEILLEGMKDHEATAYELRQLRALEVLEGVGTEEARRVAAQLTEEKAGSLVSRAAKATLARWKK